MCRLTTYNYMVMKSESNDPSVHKNTGLTRVFKAFNYSMCGLKHGLKNEAAFREEFILACVLVPVSCLLHVPLAQHLILVGSIFLVLLVELLNSALEAVVDDVSLEHRSLAKQAKDMGSAAVFFALLNCFICWTSIIVVNWEHILG